MFDYIYLQIRNKKNPIILDIGAWDGASGLKFKKKFKNAKVYAFEPDKRCITIFKNKREKDNIELIEKAICSTNGIIKWYPSSGKRKKIKEDTTEWNCSNSIKEPKKHLIYLPEIKFEKEEEVIGIKLDTWFESQPDIKYIDLIWADVNGGEKELIEGGINTLTKYVHLFYTEYSNEEMWEGQPSLDKILKMLPTFKLLKIKGDNALLKNTRAKERRNI